MHLATSTISAPVASHMEEIALMDEMRWARNALDAILASSADWRNCEEIWLKWQTHTKDFVVSMRSAGTQWRYTEISAAAAEYPCPMVTSAKKRG